MVCRRDFCRVVDRVLASEGLDALQRGTLELVIDATRSDRPDRDNEVIVVSGERARVARFVDVLKTCPLRAEADVIFRLYSIGGDEWDDHSD